MRTPPFPLRLDGDAPITHSMQDGQRSYERGLRNIGRAIDALPVVDARIVVGPARRTKVVTLQMRVSCGALEKLANLKKASEAVENRTTLQRQVKTGARAFVLKTMNKTNHTRCP